MIDTDKFTPDKNDPNLLVYSERPECCPNCGSADLKINSNYSRKILDISPDGKLGRITLTGKRYLCRSCGKSFSPGLESRSSLTRRLVEYMAQTLSMLNVAPKKFGRGLGLPLNTIRRNLDSYYAMMEKNHRIKPPDCLYLYFWQEMIFYIDPDQEIIFETGSNKNIDKEILDKADRIALAGSVPSGIKFPDNCSGKVTDISETGKRELENRVFRTLGISPDKNIRTAKDVNFTRRRILFGGNRRQAKTSSLTGKLICGDGRILE